MLLAVVVAGALAGCGDDPAGPLRECDARDNYKGAITVTAGTTPRIDWAPACRARQVHVGDVSGPPAPFPEGIMWEVTTYAGNDIVPGLRYGEPPEGAAEEYGPAKPLVPGRRYMISVTALSALGDLTVVDVREFTP